MYAMENDQDSKDYQLPNTTAEMPFFEQLGGVDFVETEQADEQSADEQPPQTIYHVYMVKEPDPTETPLVVEQAHPPQKRKPVLLVLLIGIPVITTLLGLAAGLLWPILFAPTVTVTLFPTQQTITTIQTITLVPGVPQRAE